MRCVAKLKKASKAKKAMQSLAKSLSNKIEVILEQQSNLQL